MTDKLHIEMSKLREDFEAALEAFIYQFADDIPKDSPAYSEIREDFIYALCSGSERLK